MIREHCILSDTNAINLCDFACMIEPTGMIYAKVVNRQVPKINIDIRYIDINDINVDIRMQCTSESIKAATSEWSF